MDKEAAKPRIPVSLDGEQHEKITKAAKSVGLTISAYIRLAALEKAAGQNTTAPR